MQCSDGRTRMKKKTSFSHVMIGIKFDFSIKNSFALQRAEELAKSFLRAVCFCNTGSSDALREGHKLKFYSAVHSEKRLTEIEQSSNISPPAH